MQKTILALTLLFLFSAASPIMAQNGDKTISTRAMTRQYPLLINEQVTTVLIFPAPIAPDGVDRGAAGVIAGTVSGVTNVLKVKAATKDIAPTNLTVLTTDGQVYSFWLEYSRYADSRPIDLRKQHRQEASEAFFKDRILNDGQVKALAAQVAHRKPFMRHPKTRSFGIHAKLQGIYISKDVVFFRIGLHNKTHIDYALDFLRCYIRNRKRVKRTAEQDDELKPLYCYQAHGPVTAGKTRNDIVIALRKFTIEDHKNFVVQLFEKGGDRNIILKTDGKDIVKARRLTPPLP